MLQMVAALALWMLLRRMKTQKTTASVGVLVACVALALSASLSGHPVAAPNAAWAAVSLDALHILAAGGWIGSLLVLMVAGLPAIVMSLPPESRGTAVRTLFSTFSPMALACGGIVLLTGAIGAWFELGALKPLFASTYGRILLVKLGILLLVAGVGAYNWRATLPGLGSEQATSGLRRTAGAELALAAVVLLVTAVLTATTPPISGAP
jgi:copper transport protein